MTSDKKERQSTDEMTGLDREILILHHKKQLAVSEGNLLSAQLEIKKAERAMQKYKDTIDDLVNQIAETKAQIADLEKGGEI